LATPLAMRQIKRPAEAGSESGQRLVAITIVFSANQKILQRGGFRQQRYPETVTVK
jgi:hypothetical protein